MAVSLRTSVRGCQSALMRPSIFVSSVRIRRFATFSHRGEQHDPRIKATISPNYKGTGIVLLALSVLGISTYMTTEAQSIPGEVVKHFFFNAKVDTARKAVEKILKRIDTMRQSAMTEGFTQMSQQQTEFFNNIELQLQNFAALYERSLDYTVETMGREASSQLAQIDTMVHDWSELIANPDVKKIAQQYQALVSNFALVSDIPKVVAFYPTFVSPHLTDHHIIIECVGAFPPVSSPEMEPKLILHNNTYPLSENRGGILCFYVPYSDAFPSGNSSLCNYTVQIPHLQKGWFCNSVKDYQYKGSIRVLPESPGKIVLQYAHVETSFETKEISSLSHKQTSRPYGFNRDAIDIPYQLTTEPGWKIKPGTSKFIVHENKGDKKKSSWKLGQETPDRVTWHVSTHKYSPAKHCDKITFTIAAIVERAITNTTTKEKEVDLKWGDSMVIGVAGDRSTITFKAFDGTTQVLVPNTRSKYVEFINRGGRTILSVKSPEEISYFNFHKLEVSNNEKKT
ncbi:MAG: hypothetical protein ABSA17_03730 [Rhabdochlamydiaceae bacterium]